jgi:putative zinc finger/helix-turn-helix YgiT family protein
MRRIEMCCEVCGSSESTIVKKKEAIGVRGEDVVIEADVRVCLCGNELFDEELDRDNLSRAYDLYRSRRGIMTPFEIRHMREAYGVSQRGLSKLLGWGDVTLHRYETGAVPDPSHSKLLDLLKDPAVMKSVLVKGRDLLPRTTFETVMANVVERLDEQAPRTSLLSLQGKFDSGEADIFSGFRRFDITKFTHALLYFAQHTSCLYKTKVNKLLFYADFVHFQEFLVSITGSRYLKYEFGPVPEKYDGLLWEVAQLGLISVSEEPIGQYVGNVIRPLAEYDPTVFSDDELRVLDEVSCRYGEMTARAISERSHKEDGWLETDPSHPIPYSFAERLKTI